ncbi:MAG: hypothetical protein E7311_01985 [Clostridiales bacterium]|nr:hypothetical protein [Clostridiales bacterium]
MYLKLKQSLIKNWWVAPKDDPMTFINILKRENIKQDLLVVGEYEHSISTSTNKVKKVTQNGVITAKGTFYPFEEANGIYMQFLVEINKANVIFATWWEKRGKNKIIADIEYGNKTIKKAEFDFVPYANSFGIYISGFSKRLDANVVLNPLREGNYCTKLMIPDEIKQKIYKGRFFLGLTPAEKERIKKIRQIFYSNL